MATVSTGSSQRFRVSTSSRPPPGFFQYSTIHLRRLSWSTRVKVWTGQIKWLYILRDLESKKEIELAAKKELNLGATKERPST